jgi:hypothetical protein
VRLSQETDRRHYGSRTPLPAAPRVRPWRQYLRTASSHWAFDGAMRKAFGYFTGSIRLSTTQGWMSGILKRAMMGVVAKASPELVGPQIACNLQPAYHFLRRVHRFGGIALGIAGDDFDHSALRATAGIDRIGSVAHAAIKTGAGRRGGPGNAVSTITIRIIETSSRSPFWREPCHRYCHGQRCFAQNSIAR